MARPDSITAQVAQMDPLRYTVKQAADIVGRSVDTLVRWRKQGLSVPSDSRNFGKITVHLYTESDIEHLKLMTQTQRPGRKPPDYDPEVPRITPKPRKRKKVAKK